jgi:hypothetical protein
MNYLYYKAMRGKIGIFGLINQYNKDGTEQRFIEIYKKNHWTTNEEYDKTLNNK